MPERVMWFGTSAKAGDVKVRLKHRELFFANDTKKASIETVQKAHAVLQTTIAKITGGAPTTLAHFNLYFKGYSHDICLKVKATLELVMGGMTSGDLSMKTDNTTVKRFTNTLGVDAGVVPYIEGYVRGRNVGDIHVSRNYIMNNRFQAVRVFIHEASHKFAATDDFDERGYMHADGSDFREPGITPAQCLVNADSYAYFCMAEGWK
jgi:hypothetical protein